MTAITQNTVQTNDPEAGATPSRTQIVIAEHAAMLFAQKGFSSTSIREIAANAGVTKPTVYYYFRSKQGLIEHLLESTMREFEDTIDAAAAIPSLEGALHHIVRSQVEFAIDRPATVTLLARVDSLPVDEIGTLDVHAARERSRLAMFSIFVAAQARGEIADHDPIVLTTSFFGALVVQLMLRIQRPDIEVGSPEVIADHVIRLFLDGARPRTVTP